MNGLPSLDDRRTLGGLVLLVLLGGLIIPSRWGRLALLALALLGVGTWSWRRERTFLVLLTVAFLVRVALIVGDTMVGMFPTPPITPIHNRHAIAVVEAWSQGSLTAGLGETGRMKRFVAYLYAPFYLVFGEWQVAGRIGTALFSLGMGYGTYRIVNSLATVRAAYLAVAAVLFWPSVLYRSVLFQRETLVAGALLGVVAVAVRWVDEITVESVAVVGALGAVLVFLRPENLVLAAATLGSAFFVRGLRSPQYLLATVVTTVPVFGLFLTHFTAFTGIPGEVSPAVIDAYAYRRAHGDAAYLVGLHYRSWADVLLYAPLKIVYLLFSPLPWQVARVTDLLAGASGWLLLVVGAFARRGVNSLRERRGALLVLATYFVLGVTAYAVIEMNYGAAFRRRIQFVPVLVVLAAVGASRSGLGTASADADSERD